MVACFPLGTGQKTIDSLNAVNPNFKVWNNDYSECVLYGVWKNKNEQENDAVRLQNLQMEKKIKMAQRGGSGRKRQRGGEPEVVGGYVGGFESLGEAWASLNLIQRFAWGVGPEDVELKNKMRRASCIGALQREGPWYSSRVKH